MTGTRSPWQRLSRRPLGGLVLALVLALALATASRAAEQKPKGKKDTDDRAAFSIATLPASGRAYPTAVLLAMREKLAARAEKNDATDKAPPAESARPTPANGH